MGNNTLHATRLRVSHGIGRNRGRVHELFVVPTRSLARSGTSVGNAAGNNVVLPDDFDGLLICMHTTTECIAELPVLLVGDPFHSLSYFGFDHL